MKIIEIVTPCYNEQACILPFYEAIEEIFKEQLKIYGWYVTFIDDGSTDKTFLMIQELATKANNVRYISFSRNFGKEAAIYAGLSESIGDYVVLMDVDLQHPPTLIAKMIEAIEQEDYDCATARRVNRIGEPLFRSLLSRGFYHIFDKLTGLNLLPGATDYRLMKRDMVDAIVAMQERERFTKGIYSWIGYKNKWIEYENVERANGQTKWSIRGLAKYSMNGFMAFATTPLRAAVYLGIIIVAIVTVWIIKILWNFLVHGQAIGNGTTTLELIILFLGGVIIAILGVIGEYMARIYIEIKQRPIYITRKTNISEKKDINNGKLMG